jgi:hypothetical protein
VSDYQLLTASTDVAANVNVYGTVDCPAGKKAVGGGWTTATVSTDVVIDASGPSSGGGGWTGAMSNKGTVTVHATLTAICMTVGAARPAPSAGVVDGPVLHLVYPDGAGGQPTTP